MNTIKCKICGKEFSYEKMSTCYSQFRRHLKSEHNTDYDQYLVDYELNSEWPKCKCGCGKNVSYDFHGHKWHKYFADSHVGKVNSELGAKNKQEMLAAKKIYFEMTRKRFKTI